MAEEMRRVVFGSALRFDFGEQGEQAETTGTLLDASNELFDSFVEFVSTQERIKQESQQRNHNWQKEGF